MSSVFSAGWPIGMRVLRHAGDVANDGTLVRLPGDEGSAAFSTFLERFKRREVQAEAREEGW